MRDGLIRLCEWVLARLRPASGVADDAVRVEARRWVQWADGFAPGTSGEYKRHVVYAKLIHDFPAMRRRDLALAIEQVIQEMP